MGKLGGFGSLSFVVSSNTIRTFEKLQWDVGASYATHDRHMMPDLLEFLGPDPETINLPIKFLSSWARTRYRKWSGCGL